VSGAGRRYFGTDGIRGRVGQGPISADFILRLGCAAGRALARAGHARVVIGKDTRISGYMFESALEAGLVAAGAHALMLGPIPTPAVAYLTRTLGADAGIVISASHNPHHDNGIKFFSAQGEKLDDATELAIEAALDEPFSTVASEDLGKAQRIDDARARYVDYCKASLPAGLRLDGLKIALDCAHGATYQVGPAVFSDLGAQIDAIGIEPDGLNINRGVGSTDIAALRAQVLAGGADLGIAFDGDGDRLQMVDRRGRVLDGDDLLYILALDWRASGRLCGPVVGTLMSNYALERALGQRGIDFQRARVGDRYVHKMLVDGQGVLGGETSGHLLCLDRASTGDAIVAALQVLEVLRRRDCELADLLDGFDKLPQHTENIRVAPGQRPHEQPWVQAELARAQATLTGRGRAFIRPSGTEPVIRVTVEADDAALVDDIVGRLAEAVARAG